MNTYTPPTRAVVIFFGPPGSGKGTQSEYVIAESRARGFRVPTMSAGDSLRLLQKEKSESLLAEMARNATSTGTSVAGALIVHYWVEPLSAITAADPFVYVVDGPCRKLHESELFVEFVRDLGAELFIIEFDISDQECIKRMKLRAETGGRSDDQDESVMQRRLDTYHSGTTKALASLVSYAESTMHQKAHHVVINGAQSMENVWLDIKQAIFGSLRE